ncbi:histidine phosphatase family protein [Treponema sp.]|uniref:histidine phosphatase family protein n=1 Tax=Treponema sp. TaxID=166 RepID=UPI00388E9B7B
MEIFLFRHGKTSANEKSLYCGKTDLELSEKGREELLKKPVPDISNCKIYTSGLKRTVQTLEIMYPSLASSAVTETAFQEIDFGDFEMHSYEELKGKKEYQEWLKNSFENPCPGGESYINFKERVKKAFEKLIYNERSFVIFTHGGVISVILEYLYPDERKSFYEKQPDFGDFIKIEL